MQNTNYIDIRISNAQVMGAVQRIASIEKKKIEQIKQEIATTTYAIEGAAKRAAPTGGRGKFGGRLKTSIHSQLRADGLGGRVWVAAYYGPYQEFGTGDLVNVPAGWENFAIQFKGKGLRKVNIRAHHYLFDAWAMQSQIFLDRVKLIMEKP